MLKKLLKYEFKAVSRTIVPLIAATVLLSALSAMMQTFNTRLLANRSDALSEIFGVIHGVVMFFALVAILASPFILVFILLYRFYKSFFGDEGYIAFTMPLSMGKLLAAKLISGVFWTVLGALATVISIIVLVLFGTADKGFINSEIIKTLELGLKFVLLYFETAELVIFIAEIVALLVLGVASQIMLFYLAIIIGSIVAGKHKVLASIGVFFGISMLTSILFQMVYMPILALGEAYSVHLFMVLLILLPLILAAVSFLLTRKLLEERLNLE